MENASFRLHIRSFLIIFFALVCGIAGAQTQNTLPPGSILYSSSLYKDLDGWIWTGKAGSYIRLAPQAKVDSLIKLGYSNLQIDSIAAASRMRSNHTGTQSIATIEGLQATLDNKKPNSYVPTWEEVTGKPTSFTPAAHRHAIAEVDNLGSILEGKVDKTTVIGGGNGIVVGGALANGEVSVSVNDTYLQNKFLRKDVDDENGNKTLNVGKLVSLAVEADALKLASLGAGTATDQVLVVDGTGTVKKKPATSDVNIGVANSAGANQFSLGASDAIRFSGAGDASVSFNPATKMVTISSTPGAGGGGAVTSFNSRTGAVVSAAGDYSTSQVTESPSNLYFTETRVRNTPLTGLSTATNSAVTATDNVLQAAGKLQAQVAGRALATRNLTVSGTPGRIMASGGAQNLTTDREWTVDLSPSGVAAGTYTKVGVDSYGRVTSGSTLSASDIPSLPYKPSSYVPSWTEVTGKPTTLGGYGITDAVDLSSEQVITGRKTLKGGSGNEWNQSALEIQGSSSAFPSITFHQPGIEARKFFMNNSGKLFRDTWQIYDAGDFSVDANSTANTVVKRSSSGDVAMREVVVTSESIHGVTPSSLLGIYPGTNQGVKFSKQGVNRFLGAPDDGETLQSVVQRNNVLSDNHAITFGNASKFGLKYDPALFGVNLVRWGVADGVLFASDNMNVGIGTTSPSQKLDVNGNMRTLGYHQLDGVNGTYRGLRMTTSGALRWQIAADNKTETGGGGGSNFAIYAYSDDVSNVWTALEISRANLQATFAGQVNVPGHGNSQQWNTAFNDRVSVTGADQYVTGRKIFSGGGTGNTYIQAPIEVSGNGTADKLPSISFHQPGKYASALSLREDGFYGGAYKLWSTSTFGQSHIDNWNQAYSDRVTTNTAQTVTGAKTFTQPVSGQDATADNHLVTKRQVPALAAQGSGLVRTLDMTTYSPSTSGENYTAAWYVLGGSTPYSYTVPAGTIGSKGQINIKITGEWFEGGVTTNFTAARGVRCRIVQGGNTYIKEGLAAHTIPLNGNSFRWGFDAEWTIRARGSGGLGHMFSKGMLAEITGGGAPRYNIDAGGTGMAGIDIRQPFTVYIDVYISRATTSASGWVDISSSDLQQ